MKKNIHTSSEVYKIRNHLLKVAPYISNIDIKVSKLKNGHYKSKIYVHLPKRKRIISTKVDENLPLSLDKAHQAVMKQIFKFRKVKPKRLSIRKIDFGYAA